MGNTDRLARLFSVTVSKGTKGVNNSLWFEQNTH